MLIAHHGRDSALASAIGRDRKAIASLLCYGLAIALSWFSVALAFAIYVFVAIMWFIPDRRIERALGP